MRIRQVGLTVLLLVSTLIAARAEDGRPLVIGDFAAGTDGFGGSLVRGAAEARGFGVLANASEKWAGICWTMQMPGRLPGRTGW